jgi:creatinine amidohydrolase
MTEKVLYTVREPKTLPDMTWEEVSEILKETDMVIVPVGSTEQHGPHLPLDTDNIQGIEIAKRTVMLLAAQGIKVVAGPNIPFGVAPYHMPFPGTISLSIDTLKAVIKEVCWSLYQHGFRRLALLLGHGGNMSTIQVAVEELATELPEARVVFLNDMPDLWGKGRIDELLTSDKAEGHSGEGETARILVTHANLVQMDRARVHYLERADQEEHDDQPLLGGGMSVPVRDWKAVTPYGSVGNPKLATPETGERLYDLEAEWYAAAIRRTLCEEAEIGR